MTNSEAFTLGFQFATRLRDCWDSRDVSRVMTCEDFPEEIQKLASSLNGFRSKSEGIQEAVTLIKAHLEGKL